LVPTHRDFLRQLSYVSSYKASGRKTYKLSSAALQDIGRSAYHKGEYVPPGPKQGVITGLKLQQQTVNESLQGIKRTCKSVEIDKKNS
jgi:hypothetical protein